MARYKYAFFEGELVDVEQLNMDTDHSTRQYDCVGCGQTLIAKIKGTKVKKHFAHKTKGACNPESYLHKLGKRVFKSVFGKCIEEGLPFTIQFEQIKRCDRFDIALGHSCRFEESVTTFDLTQYFDVIEEEVRDGQFIPDLRLSHSMTPGFEVYIEIAVTSFLSKEKQRSGRRIIEIPLKKDEDVLFLHERSISEKQARFVGFRRGMNVMTDAECICAKKEHHCFVTHIDGTCNMFDATLHELENECNRNATSIEYVGIRQPETRKPPWGLSRRDIFLEFIGDAKRSGASVKHCIQCEFSKKNSNLSSKKKYYCTKHRAQCFGSKAVECKWFNDRDNRW